MQLRKFLFAGLSVFVLSSTLPALTTAAIAKDKVKTAKPANGYTEDEFLKAFGGKTRKQVTEMLGQPSKKEQSVKPSNADSMLAGKVNQSTADSSRPVNVEMWYYGSVVNYAPKKAYKFTELTFVNDHVQNIAFFNNK